MNGGRDWLILAMLALMIANMAFAVVLVFDSILFAPDTAQADVFTCKPKDRPVLETLQQVWEARTTGVSEFEFDGVHYVIVNLPKEYVDYSSWYVRMP